MPGVLVAVGVTPSTAATTGVCSPWATEEQVCSPCSAETEDLSTWLQVASDILYQATDQMYPGICSDTVYPCAQTCHGDGPPYYGDLTTSRYQWYGSCGCNRTPCGCTDLPELWLSGWPLVSIEEVTIDGDVLDPSAYQINDWRRLVRIDGEQWPACSDDFTIEFTYGSALPSPAPHAAAEFACQLALACAGSSECRLPQRVQSVTRQGVSFVMLDPFQFLENGLTGLGGIVDYFLTFYGRKARDHGGALVVNPDLARAPRVRRVTS